MIILFLCACSFYLSLLLFFLFSSVLKSVDCILEFFFIIWLSLLGFFTYNVIWICEHLIKTDELARANLLNSNHIRRLCSVDNLKVVPGPKVFFEGLRALSSQPIGELFLVHIFENCFKVIAAFDLYLLSCLLIEPSFDDGPNG